MEDLVALPRLQNQDDGAVPKHRLHFLHMIHANFLRGLEQPRRRFSRSITIATMGVQSTLISWRCPAASTTDLARVLSLAPSSLLSCQSISRAIQFTTLLCNL